MYHYVGNIYLREYDFIFINFQLAVWQEAVVILITVSFQIMIERMLLLLLHTLRFLCKDLILESTFPSKIPDPVAQTVDIFIEVIKLGE